MSPASRSRQTSSARRREPAHAGIRQVEHIMGTVIGFDIRDAAVSPETVRSAFEYLHDIDRRFSPYKPDSEVSRLIRGELTAAQSSPELREVLELCEQARTASEGYFDIRAHRADGAPDPTGLVKGWSLERAARILESGGAANYCVNGGGDVVVRGSPDAGGVWRVGIRHPLEARKIATVLALNDGAVATSGAYERGEHIRDPFTGRAAAGLLSVTVVGPDLTFADAYATAAFAMGLTGIAWIAGLDGYEGCSITADPDGSNGRLTWTPGFERYFADPH